MNELAGTQGSRHSLAGFRKALKIFLKKQIGGLKLLRKNGQHPLHAFEYRVFSQHREDGIIDHLLNVVGSKHKTFVEFGFHPDQNNCLNLALNRGYRGLFIDGSSANCQLARDAYSWLGVNDVTVANAFLTTDNINFIISENGFSDEIDVLSVDVDGNDYWLWSIIDVVSPRIVIAEYNASFGSERRVTVPYDPEFVRYDKHPSGFYHGASLAALETLGKQKGYQLCGCDFTGVNAFFVRQDLVTSALPTSTATQSFMDNLGRTKYKGIDTVSQFERIKDMPYVEVG